MLKRQKIVHTVAIILQAMRVAGLQLSHIEVDQLSELRLIQHLMMCYPSLG